MPGCLTDTPSRHFANVSPADEQDVKPHDIRPNRNAGRENVTSDRRLHNNPADRTKNFFPDDVSDDPRRHSPAEDSGKSAVSQAAALASDAIVPVESHGLFRCTDTGVELSTPASDGPTPGKPGCNSGSEHRTAEIGSCIPSAGSFATRCDRPELARSHVLKDPEEGPRELLSRKVKSRIEAGTSIRGEYFNASDIRRAPALQDTSAKYPQPLGQLMDIHLWLSNPGTLNKLAETTWPLTRLT